MKVKSINHIIFLGYYCIMKDIIVKMYNGDIFEFQLGRRECIDLYEMDIVKLATTIAKWATRNFAFIGDDRKSTHYTNRGLLTNNNLIDIFGIGSPEYEYLSAALRIKFLQNYRG